MLDLKLAKSIIKKSFSPLILNNVLNNLDNIEIKNKYEKIMVEEQYYVNFPILYLSSIKLCAHAQQNGIRLFLFATRDCCHFIKIFNKLFPSEKVCYFHSSRIMFDKCLSLSKDTGNSRDYGDSKDNYVKYIKNILLEHKVSINECIFVDVHGKGWRMLSFFEKYFNDVPFCYFLSSKYKDPLEIPPICRKYYEKQKYTVVAWGVDGAPIEMLNYDVIGTLIDFGFDLGSDFSGKDIRKSLEYDKEIVLVYHNAMNQIITQLNPKYADSADINTLHINNDDGENDNVLKDLFLIISQKLPVICKRIKHQYTHNA